MTATLPYCDSSFLIIGQTSEVYSDIESIPGKVFVDGAEVTYTIHHPKSTQVGEYATRLIVPGYFGCETAYSYFAKELAKRGETVTTFSPARHQGAQSLHPDNLIHPERLLPKAATEIAHALQLDYDIEEYHLSGNSMGGPAAMAVAKYSTEHPNEPRAASVELLASAGVTRHNTVTLGIASLALRGEMHHARKLSHQRRDYLAGSIARHGLRNVARTIGEGFQVSNCRIRPNDINELQNKGVAITGLFHDKDPYFPARAARESIGRQVNEFIHGQPAEGGHLAPYIYPAEVAEDSHTALEMIKDRPTVIKPAPVVIT